MVKQTLSSMVKGDSFTFYPSNKGYKSLQTTVSSLRRDLNVGFKVSCFRDLDNIIIKKTVTRL